MGYGTTLTPLSLLMGYKRLQDVPAILLSGLVSGISAAFNKGLSGGGYGLLVTSGQILSGVKSKSAIGVTSLAENLTCLVGIQAYLSLADHTVDWQPAPYLVTGAICSDS